MNELIKRIIEVLAGQRDVYAQLTAKSERKREAILDSNVEALEEIVKEEQELLVRVQDLERVRKTVLGSVAEIMQRPADGLTIADIIEVCPPSLLMSLQQIQKELTAQLHAQVNINEVNRKLLESRLEYISFMVDSSNPDHSNAYNPAGGDAKKQTKSSRIIDLGV